MLNLLMLVSLKFGFAIIPRIQLPYWCKRNMGGPHDMGPPRPNSLMTWSFPQAPNGQQSGDPLSGIGPPKGADLFVKHEHSSLCIHLR